ncbi:MAG: hypothetical protein ACXWEH_07870 [Actinomycetota bacterium]
MPKSVDKLLEEASVRLERLTAELAWAELSSGAAVLVDTRTPEQRAEAGLPLVRGPATGP